MPFDKESGAAGGRKGGLNRWRGKDPATVRNVHVRIAVTPTELAMIDEKAAAAGVSRVECIVRAVEKL